MADAFEFYKPLRNHLRQVSLTESLGVVRAYIQYMQFGAAFPGDIEVASYFLRAQDAVERKMFEWELDLLCREIILHAADGPANYSPKTLRKWDYLAGAINKLKDLENDLAKLYPEGHILLELHRIAHRQFHWQRRPSGTWIARYYKIFGDAALAAIIERKIGLTVRDLYRLGLGMTGTYLDTLALTYPPNIAIPNLDRTKLDRFLAHFAIDIDDLKLEITATQQLNENYAYVFSPLRIHPLVWIEQRARIIAPIPTFLIRRFTEGVYYEIRDEPDFSDAFGRSFQRYVGDVVARSNRAGRLTLHAEAEYVAGKDRRDTVDWMVAETSGTVFVESKTKRLRLEAKTILSREALDSEMEKLARFIVQVYKTINDYRQGKYPQKQYAGEAILPMVVTLEEWHAFGDLIQGEIERRVERKLTEAGLPVIWLQEMPFVTCSAEDFESAIQVITAVGVTAVLAGRRKDPEYRKWELGVFLRREFPEEMRNVKPLFDEVLDELTAEE
jgi:hypothetical protein